jgi:hypothetical protein
LQTHTFDDGVEISFNFMKLNEVEDKELYCVEVSDGLQLWWRLIMLWKLLERISRFQLKAI